MLKMSKNVPKLYKGPSLETVMAPFFGGGEFFIAGGYISREPRNLQTHTKSLQQFTLFWPEFDFTVFLYILSNEGIVQLDLN